ncbi:MAG TPA: ribose 5-phosphate isomerase A, partial [Myxococcales bacterium]|nr:ribose 5-phosphate isomerase A [Myxococcales bacterium]
MDVDAQRKAAGERAAQFVQDGMVIGYGTGRGATAALESLAARGVKVRGVPTSERTAETCRKLGLALTTLED